MIFLWLIVMSLPDQEATPFKPADEFELKTKYEFRQRAIENTRVIEYEASSRPSIGLLPYLELELKVIKKQPEEERIRVTTNMKKTLLHRKLTEGMVVNLDLGFTADMKDRITAHEYEITFVSSDKRKSISRIVISIEKDGMYFVNGENRGKL